MIELVRQNYKNNKRLFNDVKFQLSSFLGKNAKIEHVGSTAIPHMSGKNIIDILVGAPDVESLKQYAVNIEKSGFYPSDKNNAETSYLFFASSRSETKSGDIHIHLALENSQRHDDFLYLRDFLLCHPDEAKKYANIKRMIAKKIKNQRENYKNLKSEYVSNLLVLSRKEFNGKVPE